MKKLQFMLIITLCTIFSAYGQTKKQDIIKLLEINGTKAQVAQMADLTITQMQASIPGIPQEKWGEKFGNEIMMELQKQGNF